MTEDEKYVRAHIDTPWPIFDQWPSVFIEWTAADYKQAAKVLRTRQAQIRDVEEEIALMEFVSSVQDADNDIEAAKRILAARQAALADLKRGLRVAE
jgi:hypothetical protein